MVKGHDHHIVGARKFCTIKRIVVVGVAVIESAAVKPDHDGAFRVPVAHRCPDVQVQTIVAHGGYGVGGREFRVLHQWRLRGYVAVFAALHHGVPFFMFMSRHETLGAGIRHAFEHGHTVLYVSLYPAGSGGSNQLLCVLRTVGACRHGKCGQQYDDMSYFHCQNSRNASRQCVSATKL